jgi:ATP-binding cassette subfamily B multidrug efflux pump
MSNQQKPQKDGKRNGRSPEKEFDLRIGIEEQERRDREERIRALLKEDDDDMLGKAYDGRLVRRLLGYMRPYMTKLVLAIVLMIISSLLAVSQPSIVGLAIDDGIRAGELDTLRLWTIVFAVAAVGEWITNRFRIAVMAYVGTKVVADYRSACSATCTPCRSTSTTTTASAA